MWYLLVAGLLIFFPQGKVYVMYIGMEEVHDYKHWMKLATVSCILDHAAYSIIYGSCTLVIIMP